MANSNARIIEKDMLQDQLAPTEAGDSVIVDLFGTEGGSSKYSCQFDYTVGTFSAAACASATNVFNETDEDHPSEFLKTGHGFVTGLKVQATTSDTLPDPLLPATDYFVIVIDANYFQLASSLVNALAGTHIDLVDVGVGTQTITPVALAGASIKLQKSNNGATWVDVAAATSISTSGSVFIEVANVSYRYIKAVKALTAGSVDVKALLLAIGDAQ